jgi:hypothetical protein
MLFNVLKNGICQWTETKSGISLKISNQAIRGPGNERTNYGRNPPIRQYMPVRKKRIPRAAKRMDTHIKQTHDQELSA